MPRNNNNQIYLVGSANSPTSSRQVKPAGHVGPIVNMETTQEGTLRTVRRPQSMYTFGNPNPFTQPRSIFYAEVKGSQRKLLLIHDDDAIKVFNWESQSFSIIAGTTGNLVVDLPSEEVSRWTWPTQWVATPTGVVIVPQGGRAAFYDGEAIAPLGYDTAPAPPFGHGPENSAVKQRTTSPTTHPQAQMGINDAGYVATGLPGLWGSAHPVFKNCRLGTIATFPGVYSDSGASTSESDAQIKNHQKGELLPGRYRAVVQHVDQWGNLSPLSAPSNDVKFSRQPSTGIMKATFAWNVVPNITDMEWVDPDLARMQVAWDVPAGREGTIARIVGRTKDLENSGDSSYYELPQNAMFGGGIGTLPDNLTSLYPDNIPDAWLTNGLQDPAPVPRFRLATVAFGTLVIANFENDEGALMQSYPGRWGTFDRESKRYPDPRGARITGLHTVIRGLLVFTETSTFLYVSSDDGKTLRRQPISTTVGCVAPSSIRTLRNGVTVWLARDGFYAFDGESITFLFSEHRAEVDSFNRSAIGLSNAAFNPRTGEYMCWVPVSSSRRPNRCYTYDGVQWKWRTDLTIMGVCEARDDVVAFGHRTSWGSESELVVSSSEFNDVMLITRGSQYTPPSSYDTGWVHSEDFPDKHSLQRLHMKLRETSERGGEATVTVYANYRPTAVASTTIGLQRLYQDTDSDPSVWGDDSDGEDLSTATTVDRRPLHAKADLWVPAAEVLRIVVETQRRYPIEIESLYLEGQSKGTRGSEASSKQ